MSVLPDMRVQMCEHGDDDEERHREVQHKGTNRK